MFKLKVLSSFAAAHQLSTVTKQCETLHGHNWKVEVCVTGKQLTKTGILVDFGLMKRLLKTVIEKLDHKFLNDLNCFDNKNPSSENIAIYIANQMEYKIEKSGATISEVSVWESENACATYYPYT